MVRKIAVVFSIFLAGLWTLSGCSKSSSPVSPRASGGIKVSLPVGAIKAQLKSQNIVSNGSGYVTVKYRISPKGGGAVIKGALNVDLSSGDNPTLVASLPNTGKYLVAVEVFESYNETRLGTLKAKAGKASVLLATSATNQVTDAYPILLGAQEVDVQGATALSLKLGRLDMDCYRGSVNNGDGSYGFQFDRCANDYGSDMDMGVGENGALVNQHDGGNFIAYLGQGDLLDFPQVPSETKYFTNSLDAKGGPVTLGDVFVVKSPTKPGMLVWMQIANMSFYDYGGGYIQADYGFIFRTNDDGYDHYRFDMTGYGQMNCNDAVNLEVSNFEGRRSWYGRMGGMDADASGNLYVADPDNRFIRIVDASGNTTDVGTKDLYNPIGVALGKMSPTTMFVLDTGVTQVQALDTSGNLLLSSPYLGGTPTGIATDQWGSVYVAFSGNSQFNGVVKYTSGLVNPVTLMGEWWPAYGAPGTLSTPAGLDVADNGDIYVADPNNGWVQVFDPSAAFKGYIQSLESPQDVCLDGQGGLWVTNTYRVMKFNAENLNVLLGFGYFYDSNGYGNAFNWPPRALAFGGSKLFAGYDNGDGTVYVDTFNY